MSSSIPQKRCSKCEQEYPATTEYFHRRKGRKDGLVSECKTCCCTRSKLWLENNKERHLEYNRDWRASHPEQYSLGQRKWTEENRERSKDIKQRSLEKHREEWLARQRVRYIRDRDKILARKKEYYHTHPDILKAQSSRRRARKISAVGSFTAQDIESQLRSQGQKCWWCSCDIGSAYTIDHVIPLFRGGTNWPSNIVLACEKCNKSKGAKLPSEWIGRLF